MIAVGAPTTGASTSLSMVLLGIVLASHVNVCYGSNVLIGIAKVRERANRQCY